MKKQNRFQASYHDDAESEIALRHHSSSNNTSSSGASKALSILKAIFCTYLFPFPPSAFDKYSNFWTACSVLLSILVAVAILLLGIPRTLKDEEKLIPVWNAFTMENWFQYCMSFLPLYTLLVFLGIPKAREHFKKSWLPAFRNLFVPSKTKVAAQDAYEAQYVEAAGVAARETVLKNYQWLKYLPFSLTIIFCHLIPGTVQFISDAVHHQIGQPSYYYNSPNTLYWVFFLVQSCFGALEICTVGYITGIDFIIFLFFFGSIDYRWIYREWYFGGTLDYAYEFWALVYTITGLAGYLIFRKKPISGASATDEPIQFTMGLRLLDVIVLVATIGLGLGVIVPIGLGIGFIHYPPTKPFSFLILLGNSLDNFCHVAILEEFFFRGILYNGLFHKFNALLFGSTGDEEVDETKQPLVEDDDSINIQKSKKKGLVFLSRLLAMIISSAAFGFMHWPRESKALVKLAYAFMAALCGMLYCFVYIVSGNNIIASALIHMATDMIWHHVFQ